MNQDRGWDADDEDEDEKISAADREMPRPCLLETSPRPPYVLFHERLNWRWYYAQFYNRFRSSYPALWCSQKAFGPLTIVAELVDF